MAEYKLTIVTPDGVVYDDMAESVIVRTSAGYEELLKNHAPFIASLDIGRARVKIKGEWKNAACSGGAVSADNSGVKIVANTFEWADMIDVARAEAAKALAEKVIEESADNAQLDKARVKLMRAVTRIGVANNK